MSVIVVDNLWKEFKTPKTVKKGWKGGIFSFFKREYDRKVALDHISFQVKEGELIGYIGPNGSGKSTTVKILSGILVPDGGNVKILGKTPWENRIETVQQLGVVFGQRTQLWWDLPVIESFELLKEIYRIPDYAYQRSLDSLIDALEISKLCSVPVRLLSLGQRMRCELAASLLHSPKILFLDEPTIGLDAVSKLAVRDFIRHLNQKYKVTVMLTTHDMDDIECLCQRVIILNEGKIFLDGSLEDLRKKIAPERRLIVDLEDVEAKIDHSKACLIKREGHRVWLSYNPLVISTPTLISQITTQHAIRDLFVENPPIEEIIAKLYRDVNL